MDDKLKKIEAELDNVFAGSDEEQDIKRNRAAKSMQYEAIKEQRKSK